MAAISGRAIRKSGVAAVDDDDVVAAATVADELLVFGYSCKLFRDDDKAAYIDRGQHLIPWMGDAGHMIDRYDGRGYIHDMHEYEPVLGHDPWEELSAEERHLESVCDEERYAALKGDPAQNDLYHDEELKRLKAALADDGVYNEVGFSYDDTDGSTAPREAAFEGRAAGFPSRPNDDENIQSSSGLIDSGGTDEAFVPAKELNVPPAVQVPTSAKANAIIERTALFVVRQGAQMEILIKAKQAANPQFGFLAFDHELNPYYKHVVQMVKHGKYVPKPPTENNDGSGGDDEDDDDDDNSGHYLHPSLMSAKEEELMVPKLHYSRTGDDPYSLLVSRLKDTVEMDAKRNRSQSTDAVRSEIPASAPLPPPPPPPPPPGLEPVTLPGGGDDVTTDSSTFVGQIPSGVDLPPSDVQPIIDKMASYVAKNGDHFEAVVRSKNLDARFGFLKSGHPHHAYYLFKRRLFGKGVPSTNVDPTSQSFNEDDSLQDPELKAGASAVVSFSIKMKEGGGGEKRRTFTDSIDGDVLTTVARKVEQQPVKEPTEEELRLKAKLCEARLAEQRIRDKLAAAARERLAHASREKQLQLERKRKAALFLTMLRRDKDDDDDAEPSSMIGPRLPTTVEMTQMIMREDSPPILALVAAQVESKSKVPTSKIKEEEDAVRRERSRSRRRSRTPPPPPSRSHRRSQSRSGRRHRRSRSRSDSKGRHGDRERRRRELHAKRSRSPRRSSKDDRRHGSVRKAKTPPTTYSSSSGRRRASRSPHRRRRRHSSRRNDSRSRRTRSRSQASRVTKDRRKKSSTSSSSSSSTSTSSSSDSSRSSSVVSAVSCATISSGSSHKSSKRRRSSESTTTKSRKAPSKGRSPSTHKSKRRR